jgi:hypothetical protein
VLKTMSLSHSVASFSAMAVRASLSARPEELAEAFGLTEIPPIAPRYKRVVSPKLSVDEEPAEAGAETYRVLGAFVIAESANRFGVPWS